jgi:hypothetical protein
MDGYLDGSTEGFAGRLEVIEGRTGRRVRSPEGQNPARDPRRPSNERHRRLHALEVPEDVNPCRIGPRRHEGLGRKMVARLCVLERGDRRK